MSKIPAITLPVLGKKRLTPFTDTFDAALGPRWTAGATWGVSGGKAICTPATFAANQVGNGDFAAWTGDNPDTWVVVVAEDASNYVTEDAGKARIVGQAGKNFRIEQNCLTNSRWYRFSMDVIAIPTPTINIQDTNGDIVRQISTTGTKTIKGYLTSASSSIRVIEWAAGDATIDNVTAQIMTLSELLATVEAGTPNITTNIKITTSDIHPSGVVCRLDSTSSPANFILGQLKSTNGTSLNVARLTKCVGGTYTTLISAGITYSAGAVLSVVCSGTSVSLYYNTAQVGATQTVSDAGIVSNTKFGMFSTDATNQLDDFSLT